MPIDSLLLSLGLRFLVFSHPPFEWVLIPFDFVFSRIAANWWAFLKACPYCNGFWVFLLVDWLLYPGTQPTEIALKIGWAVFASWLNLMLYLIFNILREHPANKYISTNTENE